MEHKISLSIVPEFQNLKDRVCSTENSVYRDSARVNTLECTLNNLSRAFQEMGVRFSDMEANLTALSAALDRLDSQLQPATDATPVEPKEKSDLEIFEPNIDDDIKHYVDLDLITEPNYRIGIFDDDNWYDLQ